MCNEQKVSEIDYRYRLRFDGSWDTAALRRLVGGAHHVVVTAHTNADGDAVGSVTALCAILRRVSAAEVTPLLPDGCPVDLDWLPGAHDIVAGNSDRCRQAVAAADLVVCADLNNLERTGCIAPLIRESQAPRILFDHHIGPDRVAFATVFSDPDISSTCELVYWVCSQTFGHEAIDPAIAQCLFTGICTDTGTFAYSNRRQSLYIAAAELLRYGIDPMAINQQIRNVYSEARMKFFGFAMSQRLTVYPERGMALMVIRQQDMDDYGVQSAELTGLVNEVMRLKAIDCAVLVREERDPAGGMKVRLSLRSKKDTDVNRMAKELFDGGGHERAAGATSKLSLEETVKIIKLKMEN
jgi:phosphoesterase RecJ-like protein